jgi:hypothetical protein
VLEHLGRNVEAIEIVESGVLEHEGVPPDELRAARALLDRLAESTGRVRVVVVGPAEDVEVLLDGQEVDRVLWGSDIVVDVGHHRVRVERGEEEILSRDLDLEAGAEVEIIVEIPQPPETVLPPPVRPAPPFVDGEDPPEGPRGWSWLSRQWWFWTVVGVVVAGGITTGVLVGRTDGPDPVSGNLEPSIIEIGR